MGVFATGANLIEELSFEPDHAGLFGTALLEVFLPELIQLNGLPKLEDAPIVEGDVRVGRIPAAYTFKVQ